MKGPGVFGTYVEKPYEPLVAQVLIGLIQPGWVCVDVGAHLDQPLSRPPFPSHIIAWPEERD
ncbi:MAG: hypothetical protein ACPL7C_08405 [Anaerolineae bacterium]|jgi:hypothetical protein